MGEATVKARSSGRARGVLVSGRHKAYWGLRPWRRHSFVLAVAGAVYVSYGLIMAAIDPSESRTVGLSVALELLPLTGWGAVWIIVGSLALASTRWPPQSETWGYAAMSGLSALWGAMYLVGMVFFGAPINNLSGILVWWLVAFLWWAISGLRNPEILLVVDPRDLAVDDEREGP